MEDIFTLPSEWNPAWHHSRTVLLKTIPAAFEMDEILYELATSKRLNAGRCDYLSAHNSSGMPALISCLGTALTSYDRGIMRPTPRCCQDATTGRVRDGHGGGIPPQDPEIMPPLRQGPSG